MLKTVTQTLIQTTTSGDWIITKFSNGLMMLDMNTDISTNTLLMVGAATDYNATLTIPESFLNGNFVAQATIFANAAAPFLLIDNPTITVRPKTANTLDIQAKRTSALMTDGFFYSIRCVGLWK